jgi:hypothetical protein
VTGSGNLNRASLRVFGVFFVGGTLASCLTLWLTDRLLWLVERPGLPYEPLPGAWIGTLVLTLVWVSPAQLFVTTLATLYFSFLKRVSLWFVLFVMIPLCALIVTYRDISDCCDRIERGDIRKLLYWTLVVAPAELACAGYISMKVAPSPGSVGAKTGDK